MATTSPHLNWLIIRNNHSFLLKKRDIKKPFSTEPNNLTNLSSFRYNGIVHRKSVGIVPSEDRKGFTVLLKKKKYAQRPAHNTIRTTFNHGPRRSLKKLRKLLNKNKYRRDLTQAALRRASAVLRSAATVNNKKTKAD